MSIWLWIAMGVVGVALGVLQARLLRRIAGSIGDGRKVALLLAIKLALWAVFITGAILIDVRALIALVIGMSLSYGAAAWRLKHRGE